MAWDKTQPISTDSLATSQPLLAANFAAIEGVLGSSTLSAGLTLAQGSTLYATDAQTIQSLAKVTPSSMLTNWTTNNNPSWTDAGTGLSNIVNLTGLKSATSLEAVGTIKVGVWSGTAIAAGKGGTGCTIVNRGTVSASDDADTTITFATAFSDTNYTVVITGLLASFPGGTPAVVLKSKAAGSCVIHANSWGSTITVEYIAFGN